MSPQPLPITVVIPTYNRAQYLPGTIRSVLAQTYPAVEVVVLDDASTDGTSDIESTFAHDPRVRWIRHRHNLGMAANWKAGISQVRGEFFCLLNDDDILEPGFIEALASPLVADDTLVMSFCDHWIIDEHGERLEALTDQCSHHYRRTTLKSGKLANFGESAILYRSPHISCTLFRTSLVPPEVLDVRSGGFACGWLFYQCVRTGCGAYYVPARLGSYRMHSGNMCRDSRWRGYINEGHLHWYRTMVADPLLLPLRPRLSADLAAALSGYGMGLLVSGKPVQAGALFRESLLYRRSAKALSGYLLTLLGPLGGATAASLQSLRPRTTAPLFE